MKNDHFSNAMARTSDLLGRTRWRAAVAPAELPQRFKLGVCLLHCEPRQNGTVAAEDEVTLQWAAACGNDDPDPKWSAAMRNRLLPNSLLCALAVIAPEALAQPTSEPPGRGSGVVSPFDYIERHGFDSKVLGDDGRTTFITKRVVISEEDILALENDVAKLEKGIPVFDMCQFLTKGIKAKLIERRKVELDTALVNYGHVGSTVACALRVMIGAQTGAMVALYEAHDGKMYTVYFSEESVH